MQFIRKLIPIANIYVCNLVWLECKQCPADGVWRIWRLMQWVGSCVLRVITWVGSCVRGSLHVWGHVWGHPSDNGATHPGKGSICSKLFVRQGFCGWPGRVKFSPRPHRIIPRPLCPPPPQGYWAQNFLLGLMYHSRVIGVRICVFVLVFLLGCLVPEGATLGVFGAL